MRLLAVTWLALAALSLADDLGDELLAATRKGDVVKVKALLDQGADVNAKTRYNQTPLFFACDRGNLEIAKLLIERGADLSAKDNFYNATPLTLAMQNKRKEVIALLIEKGVDPSDAMRESVQKNDKAMFELILNKGKTTPVILSDSLQIAETMKRTEMVEALKAKGAKSITYDIDPATLNDYAGSFTDGGNMTLDFVLKDGKLTFNSQGFASTLVPVEKDTFRLISAGLTVRFVRKDGKVTELNFPGGGGDTVLKRK